MIFQLEKEFKQRPVVIPNDPATQFLAHLIEDFGDEWVTKIMFAGRWFYPRDQAFGAKVVGLSKYRCEVWGQKN